MQMKWVFKNKYKLIGIIIIAWIAVDSYFHKGLVRVLLPKKYPEFRNEAALPKERHLINTNKNWVKEINSVELMKEKLDKGSIGMECDVYFDTIKSIFEVHHDIDKSTGLNLETLLTTYQQLNLHASIWLDFKNLDNTTNRPALKKLSQLRELYHFNNKILVESPRADLLKDYSDSGFYTSYYIPMFNPYLINDDELKYWVDSIAKVLNHSSVNAVSGYYFQYTFLHKYFPGYDILIWAPNDRFSLINWLFKRKVNAAEEVFIVLYP
jgi:hypothetical protein